MNPVSRTMAGLVIGVASASGMPARADEAASHAIHAALAPVRAANTAAVVTAANAFLATLDAAQLAETEYPFTLSNAEHWSNLPGVTRNGPSLGPESALGTPPGPATGPGGAGGTAPTGLGAGGPPPAGYMPSGWRKSCAE